MPKTATTFKPPLTADALLAGGFARISSWHLTPTGGLVLEVALPKQVGVYAFVRDGVALYVGVAASTLAKRLKFYAAPGITQRTSQRINGLIKAELGAGAFIEIYAAFPPDQDWNGLPVHGAGGLELGIIKKFALPWNMRGTG
jgi:hypothetical protein